MTKLRKHFEITYPLYRRAVRNLKIVKEHVGDLTVQGTFYMYPSVSALEIFDRYSVDFDFIKWNGTDIKDVMEATNQMDEIEEYCLRHACEFFESKNQVA